MFTLQLINVYKNGFSYKPGTRQPGNAFTLVAEKVPCRITGTDSGNIVLFVLKKYYDTISEGIHQNYKIELVGTNLKYLVKSEPIWAGGITHHVEVDLQELVE